MKWETEIGTVEIYRDAGGLAVDINGERAYSGCTGSSLSIKLRISEDIRKWHYLNTFRVCK